MDGITGIIVGEKMKKNRIIIVAVLTCFIMIFACGCKKKLSKTIYGTWHGQLDVAEVMNYELSREMGVEGNIIKSDPVYSDISITFNEDETGEIEIDKESFADAVGQVLGSYTSLFLGIDAETLIDSLLQYAADEIDDETARSSFTYEVDDDEKAVYINIGDGAVGKLILNEEGALEFSDPDLGIDLVFKK